ncbi:MAG: hypothetical protein IPO58_24190 [Betaproteobacteria bacterium]|nr:hypothetical protein [Betaproteobacteria bacterium]
MAINDEAATGKVFLMDRFGKPASSCCLAWSESGPGRRRSGGPASARLAAMLIALRILQDDADQQGVVLRILARAVERCLHEGKWGR